jgi:hypothetical protein
LKSIFLIAFATGAFTLAAGAALAATGPVHWTALKIAGCQLLVNDKNHPIVINRHGIDHYVVAGATCPMRLGKLLTIHATIRSPTEYILEQGWLCSTNSGFCG